MFVSIDDFFKAIEPIYNVPDTVKANFKAKMRGQWKMPSYEDFMPYFKKYYGEKYRRNI